MSTSGTLAIRLPIWAEPLRLLTYDPLISIIVSYKNKKIKIKKCVCLIMRYDTYIHVRIIIIIIIAISYTHDEKTFTYFI